MNMYLKQNVKDARKLKESSSIVNNPQNG